MAGDNPPNDADTDAIQPATADPDANAEELTDDQAGVEAPGGAGTTAPDSPEEAEPGGRTGSGSGDAAGEVVADPAPGGLVGSVLRRLLSGGVGIGITAEAPLSRGEVFEILSNERRRHVIRYLRDRGGTGELGDIATQVAAWELDIPLDEVSSTQRKRVYTTLQQTHLPKMDSIGAVTYDSNSGAVEAADVLEDVDIYLEIVPGGELAWKEYYLALSIVSLALVAAVAVNVFPFSVLPPIVWAGVIASAFLVSAAAHVYYDRSLEIGEST